jgi:hypothetical protein
MTASDTGPPAMPDMASPGAALKALEDLAKRLGQAGDGKNARLIVETAAKLKAELARRDGEVAELRRLLATTRAYIGILS